METLPAFVREMAIDGALLWRSQSEAMKRFGVTAGQVEEAALERGIMPERYRRNQGLFSVEDQLILFRSQIAVVGCGGLGGYVVEQLARLGVGRIVVIDPDAFSEHNLNRQLFSSIATLGSPKVEVAAARIREINPAVELIPVAVPFSSANGAELLRGCVAAVDALDTIATRRQLAAVCNRIGIPLVHGAIGGWYGQVTTILPGDATFDLLYGLSDTENGIEQQLGNPAFTPAVVAGIEAAELCKLILKQGTPLIGRHLLIDLLSMEMHETPT